LGFLAYIVQRGANRASDFKYVYGAARHVWEHRTLSVRSQARYPITFHVLLAPLAALPLGVAVAVWALLSLAAIAALPYVLQGLSGIALRRQLLAWASTLPFFIDALVLGQSDPINIFLVVAGLLLASKNRGMAGAWLIGLAGLIKFLPLLHWGTLLSRKRSWSVWMGMALSVATGLGLLVAVVGKSGAEDGIRQQIGSLRGRHSPLGIIERGADLRPNNESIPMVLVRLCGDLPQESQRLAPIRLPRLSVRTILGLWYGTLGLLGVSWLAAAALAWSQPSERGWLAMFALGSILMLASTPICWNHYFLWTLPAALFLRHRTRILQALAVANLGVTLSPAARALGSHMMIAIGLFGLVLADLANSKSVGGSGRPDLGQETTNFSRN
jgi:alpha-1,2-mannosyltransferase